VRRDLLRVGEWPAVGGLLSVGGTAAAERRRRGGCQSLLSVGEGHTPGGGRNNLEGERPGHLLRGGEQSAEGTAINIGWRSLGAICLRQSLGCHLGPRFLLSRRQVFLAVQPLGGGGPCGVRGNRRA